MLAELKPKSVVALPQPFERLCWKASRSEVDPLFFQMQFGNETFEVPPGMPPKAFTVRCPPKSGWLSTGEATSVRSTASALLPICMQSTVLAGGAKKAGVMGRLG